MTSQPKAAGRAASKLITERIAELGDWRSATLARMRAGICTGESNKSVVKLFVQLTQPFKVSKTSVYLTDCLDLVHKTIGEL